MIQDATGKFSSRSPLPDRNSLAEVIEGWSTIVWTGRAFSLALARAGDAAAAPHIGEYGRKTNPVSRWLPFADQVRKGGPGAAFLWASGRAYWLWFFRTWSQACEILARFSLRQARMVKSRWSMTGRQSFCTSREQAFCSASVPRPCWANAAVEREADSKVRATRSLRIVFLHSDGRIAPIPGSTGRRPERHVLMASRRGSRGRGEGTSTGKCGQIGATPTKSGLPCAFSGKCKRLILRHNPGAPRFAAHLLQSCISPSRLGRQKHAETQRIRRQLWKVRFAMPTCGRPAIEPDTSSEH